ncbi:hypothetical protein halTADL_1158 [Halohasta litchfieldiae]|jgi:hypothetical protein|uniref:Uncharacterized protein n=1 Tax=Halohasta litchfieldiae TaxID=1073996 RepID=A0A1H6S0W5_9EURY|nr:hypothetical protein [Halohasta litchfieldiae]ATW87951.1 hypothetical protein halTADL_1158 [Halohasta litchfieldiae]SEI61663.1 hypothetical protein SAMN05444271_10437 [Halohasta litchfieldiae]
MAAPVWEISVSTVVSFVVGYLLWPPRAVYWAALVPFLGSPATVGIVFLTAAVAGAVVAWSRPYRLSSVTYGGLLAYVFGMLGIELAVSADSPVHLFFYATLLVCFVLGAAAERRRVGPVGGLSTNDSN